MDLECRLTGATEFIIVSGRVERYFSHKVFDSVRRARGEAPASA
jgi:hypothetical protein